MCVTMVVMFYSHFNNILIMLFEQLRNMLMQKQLPMYYPALWGWYRDEEKWTPVWMTLPEVPDTCGEDK